jgi:hypothetical protein
MVSSLGSPVESTTPKAGIEPAGGTNKEILNHQGIEPQQPFFFGRIAFIEKLYRATHAKRVIKTHTRDKVQGNSEYTHSCKD